MKETLRMGIMSTAFWWAGLAAAPGAGPASEIRNVGLIGTAVAVLGFALLAYSKREKPTPTAHHGA